MIAKLISTAVLAAALSVAAAPLPSFATEAPMNAQNIFPHDFDFLIGKWRVHHRRLNGRLVGSTDWQEFEGTSELHLTMDGQGTFDDNWLDIPGGAYRAVGVRAYDPKTKIWAIWWLDSRNPHVAMDPPVIGSFKDGDGTFECDDTLNGKPIRVRYRWTRTKTASPHWEQAFSPDGGKSWEVNWEMDFTRVSP